jgi:mRNA interferase MazF
MGAKNRYVPDRGDIVKFDFDPTLGREKAGYCPALVITEKRFNKATGLALVCPITRLTPYQRPLIVLKPVWGIYAKL